MSDRTRSGMCPTDIDALRQVEDPRVSPDGTQVAFVVADVVLDENRYRRRIYLAPTDGRAPSGPLTNGPIDVAPRWSPDASAIAFVACHPEGSAELCIQPVHRGGERIVVARLPEAPSELAWSPDAARLAFVAREPNSDRYGALGEQRTAKDMPARRITHFFSRLNGEGFVFDRPQRVMVVPADGSAPPLALTDGPFQAGDLTWAPDGTQIAFAAARHDTWDVDGAVDLFTVVADGSSQPVRLTETAAAYSSPSWSQDGTRLAYCVDPTPMESPRHERLGILSLADGARVDVTGTLDRNCHPYGSSRAPMWLGERVLCQVEDAGNVHIYSFAADGGSEPELVVGGSRWIGAFDVAGGILAFAASDATSLNELFVQAAPHRADGGDPAGGGGGGESGPTARSERRLTDLTAPFRARVAMSEPIPFVAKSADGTEVPCWAMPPALSEDGRRYPTLLNIHGGPFTSYGNKFFDEFQVEAGAGFGVVYCNPRGSSGYSEAWGRAVRWPGCEDDPGSGWGGVDYDDVMACMQEAVDRFEWIDGDRLGVLGGSYGGYMTSWIIGHTDRFKAACSERACNNLLTLEMSSDIATAFRRYVGKNHVEDPAAYLAQRARAVTTRAQHPGVLAQRAGLAR